MKPTMISYQKLFPLGVYINEGIGIEMQLDDGDSPEVALAKAKEIVHKFHKDSNPELADCQPIPHDAGYKINEEKQPEPDRTQAFIDLINSKYQTKKTLESLKPKVEQENNPAIQQAFDNKLKQLQ